MKIMIPRIQVHIRADFSECAFVAANSPNANAPPDLSSRVTIPPIRPHTMISHAISGSTITSPNTVEKSATTLIVPCSMISAMITARVSASRILFVENTYTTKKSAGTRHQAVPDGSSGITVNVNTQVINTTAADAIRALRPLKVSTSA